MSNFIIVPAWLLHWELNKAGRRNTASVLARLYDLATNMVNNQYQIEFDDSAMILPTNELIRKLRFTLSPKAVQRALAVLTEEGVIDRHGIKGQQTISINMEKFEAIRSENYVEGQFSLYYWTIAYEAKYHAGSHVSYFLSKMYQLATSKVGLPESMSQKYKHQMLFGLFTRDQENHMSKLLVDDAVLNKRSPRSNDDGWATTQYYSINKTMIDVLKDEYSKSLVEKRVYIDVDEKLDDTKDDKPKNKAKNKSKNTRSFDGVKSDTVTPDEMIKIRSRWAELEAQGKRTEY